MTAADAAQFLNQTVQSVHYRIKEKKLDFKKEDSADDFTLNEIIWKSVRGAASPMPAPVRANFVFATPSNRDRD